MSIRSLEPADVDEVVRFSVEAWSPVFASLEAEMGTEVFRAIYPDWRSDQAEAVRGVCTDDATDAWVAEHDGRPVGFVAVSIIDEGAAKVGEIVMVAVAPPHQGSGLGAELVQHGLDAIRAQDVGIAVVATGGDAGHAPARALYKRFGFDPLPLVRYYRTL